jgi:hypothetical protein
MKQVALREARRKFFQDSQEGRFKNQEECSTYHVHEAVIREDGVQSNNVLMPLQLGKYVHFISNALNL